MKSGKDNSIDNAVMLVIVTCLFFFGGCDGSNLPDPGDGTVTPSSSWGMDGGDQTRRNLSAYNGPINNTVAWERVLEGREYLSATVTDDGSVYVGADAVLIALNNKGKERWRYTNQGLFEYAPFIAENGDILIISLYGQLVRLASNGEVLWEQTLPGEVIRAPGFSRAGDCVVVLDSDTTDSQLYFISADGSVRWQHEASEDSNVYLPLLAVNESSVVFKDKKITKVFAANGNLVYQLDDSSDCIYYPLALLPNGNLVVYLSGETNELAVYDVSGNETDSVSADYVNMKYAYFDHIGAVYVKVGQSSYRVIDETGISAVKDNIDGVVFHANADGSFLTLTTDEELNFYDINGLLTNTISPFTRNDCECVCSNNGQYVAAVDASYHKAPIVEYVSTESETGWSYYTGYSDNCALLMTDAKTLLLYDDMLFKHCNLSGEACQEDVFLAQSIFQVIAAADGEFYFTTNANTLWRQPDKGEAIELLAVAGFNSLYSLAASQSRLYMPKDVILYSLDYDGEREYAFVADSRINQAPAIGADETAYFQDDMGTCYAVSSNGEERWRYEMADSNSQQSAVLINSSTIAFPGEHSFVLLDTTGIQTGRIEFPEGELTYGVAVGPDGTIYLPLLEAEDEDPAGTLQQPDEAGDAISLTDLEYPCVCAITPDCQLVWSSVLENELAARPVVDQSNHVYLLNNEDEVFCLDADGTELWSQELNMPLPPVIQGDQLIITGNGQLAVLHEGMLTMFKD
ncbi:PQQ-binding-like beta-propeller repeat protein [bacterium]|nr:PQQ-binding-like beta-propeller repeat protein [bacterium]